MSILLHETASIIEIAGSGTLVQAEISAVRASSVLHGDEATYGPHWAADGYISPVHMDFWHSALGREREPNTHAYSDTSI